MAEGIKKPETKTGEKETSSKLGQNKEREFIIPLRRKFIKTAEYRRAPKSIRAIKEFLVRHMKLYDRDLKKIKVDKYLNEFIWRRGIKNPPSKIKVKAVADGEFIRAELAELTEKLRFKKERLEKRDKMAAAV
ncbi:MAG: 50S ribosomal protein L31e, partial [Nanoarchaeota archaeon]